MVYIFLQDGSVYVYDVLTGVIVNKLTGHEATVRDVSWHPSIPVVASSSWDGSIMLWKPNTAVCDSGKGSSSDDE
jgi:DDB1- and CUL4-associated factor 11